MLSISAIPNRYFSLAIVVLAGTALLLIAGLQLMPAQAASQQVGVAPLGQNAFEFIGRVDQNGFNFTGYGYLTQIKGLSNDQIYTSPAAASEDTARFTYVATAALTSRAILSDVFVINSQGSITFYFTESPPDRDFNNPTSFASGTPIATGSMRYQDILLVQSSNKGLATGVGEVTQLSDTSFTLGGQSYQLGQSNLFYRFSTVGNGTRTDPGPPISVVLLAGNAVTSGEGTFLPLINRNSP